MWRVTKNIILLLCIVGGTGLPFDAHSAETVQLRVTWNYAANISEVAGFRLYSTNNLICQASDPAAREMTCAVVVQNQSMPFVMTTYDSAGGESAASDVFWVDFGQMNPPAPSEPVAYINASPVYGIAPLQVHFDGSKSLDPDGTIVAYAWDFSDGEQAAVTSPAHTFSVPGVYTVALVVTDDQGNTTKAESMVTVIGGQVKSAGLPPTAVIAAQVQVDGAGLLWVNFDGGKSADVDGTVALYRWDFGDGESGAGALVSHTYGAPGIYTATLVVADNDGLTGQVRQEIVLAGLPVDPSAVAQDNGTSAAVSTDAGGSVPSDNGTSAGTSATANGGGGGGGGCSVRPHGGEGSGGVDWLPPLIFVTVLPIVARLRKSTGRIK